MIYWGTRCSSTLLDLIVENQFLNPVKDVSRVCCVMNHYFHTYSYSFVSLYCSKPAGSNGPNTQKKITEFLVLVCELSLKLCAVLFSLSSSKWCSSVASSAQNVNLPKAMEVGTEYSGLLKMKFKLFLSISIFTAGAGAI